jgi:hypothetical protein
MTEASSQYRPVHQREDAASGWATGFVMFAAVMMVMTGAFQALNGLVAIFRDKFYVTVSNYLVELDLTTWGWVHLVVGVVVGLAGFALLSGRTWARVVGIVLAVLSAIENFVFLPYYPIWSLLIIALDVFVIWALVTHGRALRAAA